MTAGYKVLMDKLAQHLDALARDFDSYAGARAADDASAGLPDAAGMVFQDDRPR